MAISLLRRTKAQTEVVSETTASMPVLILNKSVFPLGRKRNICFGGGKCYVFNKAKDKAQSATITDYVSITNPNADRDWNDDTYASYTPPSNAVTNLRLYDFGSVKTRFVYIKMYSGSTAVSSEIHYSADGNTWSLLFSVAGTTKAFFGKANFRYLKWVGNNTSQYGYATYLYSIEVFDLDDPELSSDKSPLVDVGDGDLHSVIIDGEGSVAYYVYDISEVKLIHVEGIIEVE